MAPVSDLASLATRYSALYTGAVSDVLDRRGCLQQTLPPFLRPLRDGMRLAGPAYPVKGRPHPGHEYDASIRLVLEMLGRVPAGHVLVYQTNDVTSAQLGELSVTSLKARGSAGAVIDGGCRDVEFILAEDYPVFARHVTPQDCVVRWEVVGHGDVTIEIGGVTVASGDYVVGDRDGIIVVPAAIVESVLAEAEAKVATENAIRAAVRNGMLPIEAYERYGTF
jgi:4-hydroxy-4-methyl-2-oxoglutarate aldolase